MFRKAFLRTLFNLYGLLTLVTLLEPSVDMTLVCMSLYEYFNSLS